MEWVVYAISKDVKIVETPEGAELNVDPEEMKYLYVGFTHQFEVRMGQHFSLAHDESYERSKKFYNRVKNRWDDFDKTILVRGIQTEEEAKKIEIELIAKYNSYKKGMNSTPGGDGMGSGADHPFAHKIRAYNNSTGEEKTYTWFGGAVEELGISQTSISHVLSSDYPNYTQAQSKDGVWFQFKDAEDDTPFMKNMPSPSERQSGADNPTARAIRAHNNSTGEEKTYTWTGEAVVELGISESSINSVLSPDKPKYTQAKSKDGMYYQFKYAEDTTPFIENMPTRYEKQLGANNHKAHAIIAYNNSTGEKTPYTYIGECATRLGILESSISSILSSDTNDTQAQSKDGIWYQFKCAKDTTPFVINMPTPNKKRSDAKKGGRNPQAKPVCVFDKLYDSTATASGCLIDVVNSNDKEFIYKWIRRNKFPDKVFRVSKEFYEQYKDSDIRITKDHVLSFENSNM